MSLPFPPTLFPLAVIDFEASSLDALSYPIEAGVAVVTAAGEEPEVWSSLIRPAPEWLETSEWDRDAEKIHHIRPFELRSGMAQREVAAELNRILSHIGHVYCDGGEYDVLWLQVLFDGSGLTPAFELRHISNLFRDGSVDEPRYRTALARSKTPHRAGPDAARIAMGLVDSLSSQPLT